MIVDSTTIGLIGAGSLAAGLGTTFAVQKKFGISVRNVDQKSLKQRSEEMQERFKFGQPFQGSALFGAMSREQEERQREALMRSGLKISALMFWASKIICVAVGIIVGVLIGTKLTGLATMAAAALGGMVGYILPEIYLLQKRREWRGDIERELPNALDLMSITMAAGSTFDDAVRTVAENSEGALAEGFRDVLANARFMDITDALKQFADNAGVRPLTIFVASLIQARQTGAQFVEVLENQAQTVRTYRRQKLEEEINKIGTKMLIPIIFLIFPALFGVLLAPAAMSAIQAMSSL